MLTTSEAALLLNRVIVVSSFTDIPSFSSCVSVSSLFSVLSDLSLVSLADKFVVDVVASCVSELVGAFLVLKEALSSFIASSYEGGEPLIAYNGGGGIGKGQRSE